jgi:all-trans-8'-apo-beta-carotenal 15,15'-oxygenase
VYRWGESLLCGWEGGAPHRVGRTNLATIGPEEFRSSLQGESFLAHVRFDRAKKRLVGMSQRLGRTTTLTFREYNQSCAPVTAKVHVHGGAMFIHDFAITDRYYVVAGNPLRIDPEGYLRYKLGLCSLMSIIDADRRREGTIVLIPRGDGQAITVPVGEPLFAVHHANAFDDAKGRVVLDTCAFGDVHFGHELGYHAADLPLDPTVAETLPGQRLKRFFVDPVTSRVEKYQLGDIAMDFPRVHPDRDGKETSVITGAGRADRRRKDPFDTVVRFQAADPQRPAQTWTPGKDRFVGEPVPAPRPGSSAEDDGWVLVLVYDGARSRTDLCILDARAIHKGPVAVVPVPVLLPYGFHGWFEPRA